MPNRVPEIQQKLVALVAGLLAAVVLTAAAPALAFHAAALSGGRPPASDKPWFVSIEPTVGWLNGSADELVFGYPLGNKYKYSELNWELKNVVMGGLQGSAGYGRLRLNAGYWKALSDNGGTMVDRDWNYADEWTPYYPPSDSNWTDESRHPDTTLDKGEAFDVNLSVTALQTGAFSLSGILGYKRDSWGWSSRGGTFVYSVNGFRDFSGDFETYFGKDVLVISYEQTYTVPYAGVSAAWASPAFRVEGYALFSGWVSATDTDFHALRADLTGQYFYGDFSKGTFVGLGLGATWAFVPGWSASCSVEYESIPEITGDVRTAGGEGSGTYEGGGGIAYEAWMASLSVGYRF